MRRRYTTRFYRSIVERCLAANPDTCIGADVMVGFPGETEEEHRQSLEFVGAVGLSYLHVFSFSPRQGTEAATMPAQVPAQVRARRSAEMRALHDTLKAGFTARACGRKFEAIVLEDTDAGSGRYRSLTDHYLEVLVEASAEDRGRLVQVRVDSIDGARAHGTIVSRPSSGRLLQLVALDGAGAPGPG